MSTTTVPESLHDDILEAADVGYQAAAEKLGMDPEEIHRLEACLDVSEFMIDHLLDKGHPATHVLAQGPMDNGPHKYVQVEYDPPVFADATWQQFLPPDAPVPDGAPKVLIGDRPTIRAQAKAHGVPPRHLGRWGRDEAPAHTFPPKDSSS